MDGVTIVATANFVLATRDTGYASPATALAELIDNALQAAANNISVHVRNDPSSEGLTVAVIDDGCGMDAATLRTALQFGGTPRFNDRSGQGRFGMGLPNSSVSHARRVDVYSWRQRSAVLHSYLDVDEIAGGHLHLVPPPVRRKLPPWPDVLATNTGTLVVWSKCDRLKYRDATHLARELHRALGQIFRYFLWRGVSITVNREPIAAVDPLFLKGSVAQATEYGNPLTYRIRLPTSKSESSLIRARFSELPVLELHDLPNSAKRQIGIVKGGGVSVVRARREVAYGWYFMGTKRRENYDDWWRCEIAFEPELDEHFGVTHSKQGINPAPELLQILSPDLEAIAHILNSRVRATYAQVRAEYHGHATEIAVKKERQLPAIGWSTRSIQVKERELTQLVPGRLTYRLRVAALDDESFYSCRLSRGELILTINREHPFFVRIYRPLRAGASPRDRFPIECLLLALARVEASAASSTQRSWYRQQRRRLSNVLAAFLGG